MEKDVPDNKRTDREWEETQQTRPCPKCRGKMRWDSGMYAYWCTECGEVREEGDITCH